MSDEEKVLNSLTNKSFNSSLKKKYILIKLVNLFYEGNYKNLTIKHIMIEVKIATLVIVLKMVILMMRIYEKIPFLIVIS